MPRCAYDGAVCVRVVPTEESFGLQSPRMQPKLAKGVAQLIDVDGT